MPIGNWVSAPDAGEGATWGDLFTGAPAAADLGPKPLSNYTGGAPVSDTPSAQPYRWSGDLPDFTGAPSWLNQPGLAQQFAMNMAPKYSNYRGDINPYAGNDAQNISYAGDNIVFPAFESNLFTSNMSVPQQYQGDRWYGLLDTSRPDWQSNPAGATSYEYRDLGTDWLDTAAPYIFSAIAMAAGMPSIPGILGQAAGELGFSGLSSFLGSGGGGMGGFLSSLFGGGGGGEAGSALASLGGDFWGNDLGLYPGTATGAAAGSTGLEDLISQYANSDRFMADLGNDFSLSDVISSYAGSDRYMADLGTDAGGDFWGNDYGLYPGASAASFYPSSPITMGSAMDTGVNPSGWDTQAARLFEQAGTSGYDQYGNPIPNRWSWLRNGLPAASSIFSGAMGMNQAGQLRRLAELSANRADPWGTSGGRGLADQQLQALMRDPMQVASRDPSYAMRMQGAQRAMGIYGQDSGAMGVAGANASTDWLNQRMATLGGMAGAGVNPGAAAQLRLQGEQGADDMTSRGLASIGYGLTRAVGPQVPQSIMNWLFSQGAS